MFSKWHLLLFIGLASCGSYERENTARHARLPHTMEFELTPPAGGVVALRCLLILVGYEGDLVEQPRRICTNSDASTTPVHLERIVELSGDAPYTVSLQLRELPSTISIYGMDSAELEAEGDICSNQSIAALPDIPIYRLYTSATPASSTATTIEAVIAKDQDLATIATLSSCD